MDYSTAVKKNKKLINFSNNDPIKLQKNIKNLEYENNKLKKENKHLKDYIQQLEFQEIESFEEFINYNN